MEARGFWRTARLVVALVALIAATYYLVVAFDNITNPTSNWVFVKGVLSLDGVPSGSGFEWRAIHAIWFQIAAYVGVIICETASGILLLIGGIGGLRRSREHEAWLAAQRWTLLGCTAGLLVFFFGFIVVGGNWFVMYLNQKWNGLEPAFQNSALTLLTLMSVIAVAIGGREQER